MKKDIQNEYDSLSSYYDRKYEGYIKSTNEKALKFLRLKKGDSVLDVSGGTGVLASKMLKAGAKVTLIDISEGMLRLARKRVKNVFKRDVHDLKFKSKSFSKILSTSSFHYYKNPDKALSEFHRVLKKGGTLVIIDWCRNPLHFKFYDLFKRIFDKSHVRMYTTKELKRLVTNQGFKVVKVDRWPYKLWSFMAIKAKKR